MKRSLVSDPRTGAVHPHKTDPDAQSVSYGSDGIGPARILPTGLASY